MPYKDPEVRKAYHKKYNRDWERRKKRYKDPKRKAQRRAYNKTERGMAVRKSIYGITPEEYIEKRKKQKNRCALCGQKERRIHYKTGKPQSLSVDHNHKTNQVRALLCSDCNRALGLFLENVKLLRKAIQYLQKHKE
jgi:hypothetical protein